MMVVISSVFSGYKSPGSSPAYVGNTHNYEDGADLTRALCEKLGGKGKVALLVGTPGATATWMVSKPME